MSTAGNSAIPGRLLRQVQEKAIEVSLKASALVSILITGGIVGVLLEEAVCFFRHVSPLDFLFGTTWTPLFEPHSFGVLPLVCGTMLVTAGATVIAIPVGVATAIYLTEYADQRFRSLVKPAMELLAGVPTVVYGYFAVATVTPAIRWLFPSCEVFNAASASVVVGIMILPMVASLCDDAFRAVPQGIRLGAYAVGATRMEVSVRVVLPSALSGVLASFVLALSRAIGETMAVTLAAGATPRLTANPLQSVQTMTAYMVQVSLGDTPAGSIAYQTLFAVGALLFAITLALNLLALQVLRRYREVYD